MTFCEINTGTEMHRYLMPALRCALPAVDVEKDELRKRLERRIRDAQVELAAYDSWAVRFYNADSNTTAGEQAGAPQRGTLTNDLC